MGFSWRKHKQLYFWDITMDYVILSTPLSKSFVDFVGIHIQFVQHIQMCASVFQHDFSLAPVSQRQHVRQIQRSSVQAAQSLRHIGDALKTSSNWATQLTRHIYALRHYYHYQFIKIRLFYQCASSLKSLSPTCPMVHNKFETNIFLL